MANTVVQNPANPDARFFQLGAGLVQAGLEWGLGKRAQEERERAAKAQEEAEARRQTEVERAQKAAEFLKLIATQAASTGTSLGDFLASNPAAHKELLTTSGFAPEAIAEQLKFAQDHPWTAAEQMNAFSKRLLAGGGTEAAGAGGGPVPRKAQADGAAQAGAPPPSPRPTQIGAGAVGVQPAQRIPPPSPQPPGDALNYNIDMLGLDAGGRAFVPGAPPPTPPREGMGEAGGMTGSSGPEGGFSLTGTKPVSAPPAPPPRTLPSEPVPYVVKAGDTPAGIAAKTGSSVADVMAAAQITDPTKLQIGAELSLRRAPEPRTATEALAGVKTKLAPEVQEKLTEKAQGFEDAARDAIDSGDSRGYLKAMKGFEHLAGRIISNRDAAELEKTAEDRAYLDADIRRKLADPAWRAAYGSTSPEARATMESLGKETDPLWSALRAGQLDLLAKGAALDLERAGLERAQATALVKAAKTIAAGGIDPEEAKLNIKVLELDATALNKIIGDYKGDFGKYSKDPGFKATWERFKTSYKAVTGLDAPEPPPGEPGFFMRLLNAATSGFGGSAPSMSQDSAALKAMRTKVNPR